MKKIEIITLFCFFGVMHFSQAQTKEKKPETQPKSIDTSNLLDAQTSLYKNYLGDSLSGGKDPGSINSFLELVEKSDLTPDQKQQARDFYRKYTAHPDSRALDSLLLLLNEKTKGIPPKTKID